MNIDNKITYLTKLVLFEYDNKLFYALRLHMFLNRFNIIILILSISRMINVLNTKIIDDIIKINNNSLLFNKLLNNIIEIKTE